MLGQSFDPLDPDQRLRRGRERTAFFRQTGMFPLVVLAMLVFVPLAIWHKPWALPFLGWMAFMTHIVSGLDRLVAGLADRPPVLRNSRLMAALATIALFFVIVVPLGPFALFIVALMMIAAYLVGLLTGRIALTDEVE